MLEGGMAVEQVTWRWDRRVQAVRPRRRWRYRASVASAARLTLWFRMKS